MYTPAHHELEVLKNWKLRVSRESSSDLAERFFRDLTDKSLRRGVFRSVVELEQSIEEHIRVHNTIPNPSSGPPRPTTFSKKSATAGLP
jgi:predicted component of type VI protein secretion system